MSDFLEKRREILRFLYGDCDPNYFYPDWNDLMTVYIKIKDLELDEVDEGRRTTVMNELLNLRPDDVFEAVYQFCKWYNESKNIS